MCKCECERVCKCVSVCKPVDPGANFIERARVCKPGLMLAPVSVCPSRGVPREDGICLHTRTHTMSFGFVNAMLCTVGSAEVLTVTPLPTERGVFPGELPPPCGAAYTLKKHENRRKNSKETHFSRAAAEQRALLPRR